MEQRVTSLGAFSDKQLNRLDGQLAVMQRTLDSNILSMTDTLTDSLATMKADVTQLGKSNISLACLTKEVRGDCGVSAWASTSDHGVSVSRAPCVSVSYGVIHQE